MPELKAKASLDPSEFSRGVETMKQEVSSFANGQLMALKGQIAAAFAVGTVMNFAKEAMSSAYAVEKLAENYGVAAHQLQAMQFRAEMLTGDDQYYEMMLRKVEKLKSE